MKTTGGAVGVIGLCIAVSGLLIQAYLAVVARNISSADYLHFTSYWSLALLVGFGVFLPVEQELARLIPKVRNKGAALRSGLLVTAGITLIEVVVVLAATPLLLTSFGGEWGTVAALVAMCLVSGGQFAVRGLLIGLNRMRTYAVVLVVDSLLRVVLALVVGFMGVSDNSGFAWTLVVAIVLAHLPLVPGLVREIRSQSAAAARDAEAEPHVSVRQFAGAAGPLLLGSLCAQVLLNGLPVVVPLVAKPDEAALAGTLMATFLLVRIPLFVAVPLQTALLPSLTKLADAGKGALLRALLRLAAGLGVIGAGGVAIAYTLGPWLVRTVFGPEYVIAKLDLALLVLGVTGYLGMIITTQALVASELHLKVAWIWLSGIVVAAGTFLAVPGLLLRTELAFLLGSGVGWLVGMIYLFAHSRRQEPQGSAPCQMTSTTWSSR